MRILLTGAGGQLGAYLLRELRDGGADVIAWTGTRSAPLFGKTVLPVDLTAPDQVSAAFAAARPALVVHAAALSRVSDCYRDPERARRVNVEATALLADLCGRTGARLVLTSTDMVFSGERGNYREDDEPRALSVYGRSKAASEQAALAAPRAAVIRLSLLYGPSLNGRAAFYDEQAASLRAGRPVTLFEDEWRTPLDLLTAARAILAVARSDCTGVLHVGGPERLSRAGMGYRLAAFLGAGPSPIVVTSRSQGPAAEPRPRDLSLDSGRWRGLFPYHPWPRFDDALRELGA